MVEFYEGTRRGQRRDTILAGTFLLIAVALFFMPVEYQRPVRQLVRGSLLRPFLEAQAAVVESRADRVDVDELRAQRDSLTALVAAQGTLAEENRRLRSLLGLRQRAAAAFLPVSLVRPGTAGAESSFLLDAGRAEGVRPGSPVITADGLLGVVWEVDEHTAAGIDWTHPDFRASAMTADGEAYGIVETRPGEFREGDMMVLTGAPFHTDVREGTRIVTSGRGGIFPRGVPLGTVVGIEEADTGWRKSYLVRPAVRPAAATHGLASIGPVDLSELWHVPAPPDTIAADTVGPAAADEAR